MPYLDTCIYLDNKFDNSFHLIIEVMRPPWCTSKCHLVCIAETVIIVYASCQHVSYFILHSASCAANNNFGL